MASDAADLPSGGSPKLDGTVTWRTLLSETEQRLAAAGVADAPISARRIVEEASGFEGATLAQGLSERATTRGVARLDRMVARRTDGEPLQYVLGRWSFRYLDLMVDRRVLIPRPETEVVAERALSELRRLSAIGPAIAVDLGTGSGALGLSLAREHEGAEVWITDVSADALDVARANLAGLGHYGSKVRVAEGWWFSALPLELAGHVAVVASNPPYVAASEPLPPEVAAWEPRVALVADDDGYSAYEVLIGDAPHWLMGGGALVLECAPHQIDRLCDMAAIDFVDVEPFDDLTGRPRGIVARMAAVL